MRIRAGLVLVFLLTAFAGARAQDADAGKRAREIEAICKKSHCREAHKVRLCLEDGSAFEKDVPRLPIVLPNGWITVYPGEEIHVELTLSGDAIRSARAVAKVARPAATVTFKLGQQPASADMVLAVSHKLPQTLKYTLGVMYPTGGEVYAAPSCPVQPGLAVVESWPQPVFQLVIKDLRFLPEGASLSCEK